MGENKVSSSNSESGKLIGPSYAADVFLLVVTFSGDANLRSTLCCMELFVKKFSAHIA